MPVHSCRRSFMRSGLAFVLAAWASSCGQRGSAAPTIAPPTALPFTPAVAPSAYPAPTVYLPTVETPAAYPPLPATPTPAISSAQFNGTRALEHAAAQMQWIPRDTGSPGWTQCGDYIAQQFGQLGWEVENQRFEYQGISCRNIIAKKGSGPGIIIGAHYDARRRADRDPDPAKQADPVPAANDGASGVAVLLELARVLDPATLGHTIWLAAFDAEDNGDLDDWQWIVGSTYMASALSMAPEAVVVIDMVGDADQQLYYEQSSDQRIKEGVWAVAGQLGYTSFIPEPKYTVIDDHTPFLQQGYRAIDIIDFDYPYWHTTQDTLEKISAASLEAVGKTLEEWLLRGGPGIA
ncbi:MAG: M28 family peptidase [Roseiflexaceae bacterium]|nr:M28 family peptidase [Roseiflexaceae bacterium]